VAELEWEGHPERASLRRAIRHRLKRFDPTIRVIAEGFLAETSAIDLLAVGREGEIISIRIGRGDDDIALLTQSLADLTWLRPRLADFLKLAPGLGLEPSADPRAMLLCPEFAPETRAAIQNFPDRMIELASYRCLRQSGQLSVLLESHPPSRTQAGVQATPGDHRAERMTRPDTPPATRTKPAPPRVDLSSSAEFRTGLSDDDLLLDIDEKIALD
jgi:hypothetical protein